MTDIMFLICTISNAVLINLLRKYRVERVSGGEVMNTWPGGRRRSLEQCEHEDWNNSNYPGTRQICFRCEAPTGYCEEDGYSDEDGNDYCFNCFKVIQDEISSKDEQKQDYLTRVGEEKIFRDSYKIAIKNGLGFEFFDYFIMYLKNGNSIGEASARALYEWDM